MKPKSQVRINYFTVPSVIFVGNFIISNGPQTDDWYIYLMSKMATDRTRHSEPNLLAVDVVIDST